MSKSVEAFERKYGKRDSLFNSFISYAEYDEALKIWNAAYESLSIQQEADAKDAAMWRYIRDNDGFPGIDKVEVYLDGQSYSNGHLEKAINTAMATPTDSEEK
jgi:phage FluMu gp28-like protein